MSDIEIYILYSFLGFISLLLVTLVAAVIRLSFVIGRMDGQLTGALKRLNAVENLLHDLNGRVSALERLVGRLSDRIDSLTAHRHDDDGRVVIVPEEVAADD